MKTLKNTLTATALMAILAFGTTITNAGIIIADLTGDDTTKSDQSCTETTVKVDSGIIIADIIGIIIADLTGIIIADATERNVDCGIIIAD